jgi:hypothetical protein
LLGGKGGWDNAYVKKAMMADCPIAFAIQPQKMVEENFSFIGPIRY